MISSPYPLPLLVPQVDMRVASCLGYSASTQGIYPDIFHAAGRLRYSSNIFNGGRFGVEDQTGYVYYERTDGSFDMYCATTGVLGSAQSTATTATRFGDAYRVRFTSPNWTTQNSSAPTYTFYISGVSYTVSVASLVNLFAFSEGYTYYNASLLSTSYTVSLYYPWQYNWANDMRTSTATPLAPDVKRCALRYAESATSNTVQIIGFAPKRPMQATPVMISEERVDQLVSLSGHSYRKSYARRRIYEVKLLLDGPFDNTPYDAMALWPRFLEACDVGVTLYIDRQWLAGFWRPRTALVCPSMPNRITGALLDASSVRLVPRQDVPFCYEVTLQIADESGMEGYA